MLKVENIYKTFNPNTVNEKTALNGLCLELNEGDFVTVIGGNGAGKSTLLNALAGTWLVASGKIYIDENLALAARRGKFRSLMPGITAKEKAQYKELLAELDLGLENRITSKVGLLSGGQRQAITLLMASLKKPKLLLLDEHTAALDPKTAAKVLDTTEKIVQKDNLTTLMITHNMKDAIAHGNRLIMI